MLSFSAKVTVYVVGNALAGTGVETIPSPIEAMSALPRATLSVDFFNRLMAVRPNQLLQKTTCSSNS
jgi:hypothetical protein